MKGVFGPKCQFHPRVEPFDPEEVVRLHNNWRRKVAKGEEERGSPGPQPSASNMRKMEWDEELAKVRQFLSLIMKNLASNHRPLLDFL